MKSSPILLIRHGEAYVNVVNKAYMGNRDTLTPRWVDQAWALSHKLHTRMNALGIEEYQLHISGANRTFETALYAGFVDNLDFPVTSALNEAATSEIRSFMAIKKNPTIPLPPSITKKQDEMLSFLSNLSWWIPHICFTHGLAIASILQHIEGQHFWVPKHTEIISLQCSGDALNII